VKRVGIVGLPEAEPTTIFTALTQVAGASGKSHVAVVPVPDDRVDTLTKLHSSRKTVYTQLEFVESSSMVRRGARGAGSLSAEQLGHLRECNALLLVLGGFDAAEPANPDSDLATLDLELVYADLTVVTGTLERGSKAARAGDTEAKRMMEVAEVAKERLDAGNPLRDTPWDDADRAALTTLSLLSIKPVVVVVNVGEGSDVAIPPGAIAVAGSLEAEVAGMAAEEAAELLASFGQTERALGRVIRGVYEQLDLITFLTAGEQESRSWEVRRGASAPEAAGVIHSDFQRGFIKADIISFDELVAAGSWTAARGKGLVRQEGKTYVMREGDVVEFRFAV
jgi:ribosome-binding ATPase